MNGGGSGLAESGAHDRPRPTVAVSIHGMPAIPGLMCLPSPHLPPPNRHVTHPQSDPHPRRRPLIKSGT